MNPKIFILAIIIAAVLIVHPVSAFYSADLEQQAFGNLFNVTSSFNMYWATPNAVIDVGLILYESNEHQIEQQSKLLSEQNLLIYNETRVIWIETCYAPHYNGVGNETAWRNECENAGYPVDSNERRF